MKRLFVMLALAATAARADFHPRAINVFLSSGKSAVTLHGSATMHSIHFELAGRADWMKLRDTDVGVALTYSEVRQPQLLFPPEGGGAKDDVRAESAYFFGRKRWTRWSSIEPYVDIGSGPMWSNRRVPAATSRLNMNSQAGFGAILFARSRMPLHVGYRFSHISNGGTTGRNPGLQVHQAIIGVRVKRLH